MNKKRINVVTIGTTLSKLAVDALAGIATDSEIALQSLPAELMTQSAVDSDLLGLISKLDLVDGVNELAILARPSVSGRLDLAGIQEQVDKLGGGFPYVMSAAMGRDHLSLLKYPEDRLIFPSRSFNSSAVAEYVFGVLVPTLRDLDESVESLKYGVYSNNRLKLGRQLEGSVVGIIGGGGNISTELCLRLIAFRCKLRIFGHKDESLIRDDLRKNMADYPWALGFIDSIHIESNKSAFMSDLDIVLVTCGLNEHTRGFLNSDFFESAKPGLICMNCSRQEVVDFPSFVRWHSHQDPSAIYITDTVEASAELTKILSFSELYIYKIHLEEQHRNRVLITPHIGGHTEKALRAMIDDVLSQLINRLMTKASGW